ncbi:MAG: LacI family DNA-binding transcriptional regulator [Sedimentisphaeraceae bacterium JB056]
MAATGITIKEVARLAGVSYPVVSAVMNSNFKHIRVSDDTRKRVEEVISACDYYPNSAAVSLVNNRSCHIGFMLADLVTDGFSNAYFSGILAGVEMVCRESGWGLTISSYNLSNIDSFIFPESVGQRAVDGVILAGFVCEHVIERFKQSRIPVICIDNDMEVSCSIPTAGTDITIGLTKAVTYARQRGHQRIGYCIEYGERASRIRDLLCNEGITFFQAYEGHSDFKAADKLFNDWIDVPEGQRPTLLMATDQTLVEFLRIMGKKGIECPQDLSLISSCDTYLCEYSSPQLTAIDHNNHEIGSKSAELLISYLENKSGISNFTSTCRIVERDSVASN